MGSVTNFRRVDGAMYIVELPEQPYFIVSMFANKVVVNYKELFTDKFRDFLPSVDEAIEARGGKLFILMPNGEEVDFEEIRKDYKRVYK